MFMLWCAYILQQITSQAMEKKQHTIREEKCFSDIIRRLPQNISERFCPKYRKSRRLRLLMFYKWSDIISASCEKTTSSRDALCSFLFDSALMGRLMAGSQEQKAAALGELLRRGNQVRVSATERLRFGNLQLSLFRFVGRRQQRRHIFQIGCFACVLRFG